MSVLLTLSANGVLSCVCMHTGIYCYGSHLVTTVDIIGVIVKKDVRDKLIIYAGNYPGFYFACHREQSMPSKFCSVSDTFRNCNYETFNVFAVKIDVLR